MDYLPYAEKMHKLSCDKRKAINDKKKNYCKELLMKLKEKVGWFNLISKFEIISIEIDIDIDIF